MVNDENSTELEIEPEALRAAEFMQAQMILDTMTGKTVKSAVVEDTRISVTTGDGGAIARLSCRKGLRIDPYHPQRLVKPFSLHLIRRSLTPLHENCRLLSLSLPTVAPLYERLLANLQRLSVRLL